MERTEYPHRVRRRARIHNMPNAGFFDLDHIRFDFIVGRVSWITIFLRNRDIPLARRFVNNVPSPQTPGIRRIKIRNLFDPKVRRDINQIPFILFTWTDHAYEIRKLLN